MVRVPRAGAPTFTPANLPVHRRTVWIIPRRVADTTIARLGQLPTVTLLGPPAGRQHHPGAFADGGPNTLPLYLDLKQPEDRAWLTDPALLVRG